MNVRKITTFRKAIVRPAIFLLFAVSLFAGLAAAAKPLPLTIETEFTLPDDPALFSGVWFAGFSTEPDEAPTALSVGLAQKGGWFPVWAFQLQSDQGLLPNDLRLEQGSGILAGSQTYSLPIQQGPRWGHTYETVFSYDPTTGALSLWFYDASADEVLYSRTLQAELWQGVMHPAAGISDRAGEYVAVAPKNVHNVYVPRGVEWHVVDMQEGQPGQARLTRIDRSDVEEVAVMINLPGPISGTFNVHIESDDVSEHIASLPTPQQSVHVPIDPELLRPGFSNLYLEYVDETGTLQFTDRRQLAVGHLFAEFDHVTYDHVAGHATGSVTIQADAPFTMAVELKAILGEMVWDADAKTYRVEDGTEYTLFEGPLSFSDEPTVYPFVIPVEDADSALWHVALSIEPERPVSVMSYGTERLLTTYAPAASVADGPFTIAVLPDTQYMTHFSPQGGRPEMLTRMTHWIAEHAASNNIGLVLHVGDITDQNLRTQWQVAQDSLFLLNGIVPYALSVGNHDIGPGGNASNRQTYLNEYFPVADFASRPTFGGTFEPGRMENSFQRFRLGGNDYLILSLEFLPRDEVLDWANEVAAAYPSDRIIVITHTYTSVSGTQRTIYGDRYGIVQDPDESVNTGIDIWNKFVRKHPNIVMVFSGHVTPDAVMPRQIRIGDHGNHVYEFLVNFQHRPQGGAGWLALLEFDPSTERVGVQIYSPYLDTYRIDPMDLYGVPFCIDLEAGQFIRSYEGCHLLPEELDGVTTW